MFQKVIKRNKTYYYLWITCDSLTFYYSGYPYKFNCPSYDLKSSYCAYNVHQSWRRYTVKADKTLKHEDNSAIRIPNQVCSLLLL